MLILYERSGPCSVTDLFTYRYRNIFQTALQGEKLIKNKLIKRFRNKATYHLVRCLLFFSWLCIVVFWRGRGVGRGVGGWGVCVYHSRFQTDRAPRVNIVIDFMKKTGVSVS